MEWYKVQGSVYPVLEDTTSSKVYNYVRKNVEEKQIVIEGESVTVYEYDELKIKKEDWWIYEALQENTADIADNREGIMETYEMADSNATDVADLREAVMELYEMLTE